LDLEEWSKDLVSVLRFSELCGPHREQARSHRLTVFDWKTQSTVGASLLAMSAKRSKRACLNMET